ncbi:YadA-like family protein [Taylorella equigenitalis]|uniref:YadA-like family protein n=1 Tax=Taylorella equigenitalis TaxID=29575 RepID=UPI00240D5577|nr:YadA-like family protein [Taylorella equigenitalis]WFD79857.1 YadA-like family protein [Taylorella equigenitalis]
MNKIFKTKFNKKLGAWVAVSEFARSFCKNSKVVAVGVALVATAGIVEAKQTITEEVEIKESVVVKKDVTVDGDVFLDGFRIHAGGPTFIIDHVYPYPKNNLWEPMYFNVQIGMGASAQGQQSFAIGQYSEANGPNNFAVGHYARAQGDKSNSFGYNSYASIGSVSVGNNNVAMWNSFASGQHNYAFTNKAVSVGLHNASYGKNAISIGAANTSTTEAASSMGVFNYAGPSNLLGSKEVNGVMTPRLLDVINTNPLPYEPISDKPEDQLSAIYINSIKARLWNTSKYWQNSGLTFTANDYDSLKYLNEKEQQEISKAIEKAGKNWPHNHQSAVGNFNTVTGGFASGFGTYNTAIGDESSALGHNNLSLGTFSSAIGSWNVSLGTSSTAVGMRNIASAEHSVAVGYSNRASGYDAIAIGMDNYSKNDATTSDGSNLDGTSLVRWVQGSIGIGIGNDVGDDALGFGNGNVVNARSIAVGTKNSILNNIISVNNNSQIIIDENKKIGNSYGFVFGYNNKIYSGRSASTKNVNISGSHNFAQNAEQSSIFGFKNYLGAQVDFTDVRPDKDPKVEELNVYRISLATVIGNQNYSNASKSIVIGHSNGLTYGAQNSIVIGSNIKANRANAIYLGINASTNGYQKVTIPEGAKWAGADNKGKDWVMTIGRPDQERQIQNVAAGRISETSTDAVNGSQLNYYVTDLTSKITAVTTQAGNGLQSIVFNANSNIDGSTNGYKFDKTKTSVFIKGLDGNTNRSIFDDGNNILTFVDGEGIRIALKKSPTLENLILTGSATVAPQITFKTGGADYVLLFKDQGAQGLAGTQPKARLNFKEEDIATLSDGYAVSGTTGKANAPLNTELNFVGDSNIETTVTQDPKGKTTIKISFKGSTSGSSTQEEIKAGANKPLDEGGANPVDGVKELDIVGHADNKDKPTTDFDGGKNIQTTVAKDETSGKTTVQVALKKNLEVNSVTLDSDGSKPTKLAVNKKGTPALGKAAKKSRLAVKAKDGESEDIATINDGLSFQGDGTKQINKSLNKTLKITGGQKDASKLAKDSNVGVLVEGEGENQVLAVRLSKNLTGLDSAEFGDKVTVNASGLQIKDGPSVTEKGIDAGDMRITNIAPGMEDTDAVNVGQMNNKISKTRKELRNQIEERYGDSAAGIASAMAVATLPQPYKPGQNIMSVAGSSHEGHTAMAVGISRISKSGKWVLKGNVSGNGRGQVSAGVGAGFTWE